MSPFATLSSLVRAVFALWALLLTLANVANVILAVVKKRYLPTAAALVLSALSFLVWQVIFDYSLYVRSMATLVALSQALVGIAWAWWSAILLTLTLGAVLLLVGNARYEKSHVTPNSIKLYLDKMPCGVCCWRDNGRVIFSNICMNRLCLALTESPLRNGNQFYEAVAEGIVSVEGKMWRFVCRDVVLGGEAAHEMIASDVTTEYAKTRALERDKAELSRLKHELEEHNLGIDETVRRQEILQAKVNIHDEMNRLMLSTMAAEGKDAQTLDDIFSLWKQNALLLCKEADSTRGAHTVQRVEALADALKIELTWQGELPETLSAEQSALFASAAQEAVVNAAKHARAGHIVIAFELTDEETRCLFANDGVMPHEAVRFTGGLANLERLAAKQGAVVAVEVGDEFVLSVRFPTQNRSNG